MLTFLLCVLLIILLVVAFTINLKCIYIHYGEDKEMVYAWLHNAPKIRATGNAYMEKVGDKEYHIYFRDKTARAKIGDSVTVYINQGLICVLN